MLDIMGTFTRKIIQPHPKQIASAHLIEFGTFEIKVGLRNDAKKILSIPSSYV